MAKEHKNPHDYLQAIDLLTDAITKLQNFEKGKNVAYAKLHDARANVYMKTG